MTLNPTRRRIFAVLFALPILAVASPHAQAVDPAAALDSCRNSTKES
ncbi:MAG: hypothetical protein OXU62_01305 [Gammaproteobacteria bacterium]|nr:hypothetical protein [Gammaproteobacteria bacterium]